ncbi:MAG TPA: isoprenylcysteine carboxylmethyltransferase family protein [Mycobacterium sp.]|jgi:protein-S-isoprenylcysteine O-methyltransferase Ste14
MRATDIVIAVGWIAFWSYWLVASANAKPGRTQWTRFALVRVALFVVIVVLFRIRALHDLTLTHSALLHGVGLAAFFAGLALAVWARIYIGRNWGMPMSQKIDPELVTSGPYRVVRHPIYSGVILAMIGTAIAISWDWLVVAVLLGAYFVYSAFVEERTMTERFPDTYPRYRKSSKMLIPYIF